MGGSVKYQYILFDADQVLFDFTRAERTAFDATCAAFDLDAEALHPAYEEINGQLWKLFASQKITGEELRVSRFRHLFTKHAINRDAVAVSARYIAELTGCGFLLPGAREVVQYCKKHYTIALITNGLADVQRGRLKASGLDTLFDTIIISEEIGFPKPHPEIFNRACQTMGVQKYNAILMVGDNYESDIVGAHEFGIDTCWVNPKHETAMGIHPTMQVDDMSDLLTVLQQ